MIKPREQFPEIDINLVNDTQWKLSEQDPDKFTMVVVYRGKHCPVCKKQLEELQDKLGKFVERGVNVIAISSDTEDRAKSTYKEWDVDDLPIGYEFDIEQARDLGLFISEGIKDEPDQFIEPGIFLIRKNGDLYSAHIQSIPFARPDFDALLKGIDFILDKDYPARGEA